MMPDQVGHDYEARLLRGDAIEKAGDDGKHQIREPEGYCRREGAGVNEHLAESEEKNVCECQSDTDTDVPSDATSTLL